MVDEATQMRLLGQRIRLAREQLGISQEDLAHQWGKQQYQVSKIETGQRRVYAHDLPRLAQVLHVPISHFFQDTETQNEADLLEETLLHEFRSLTSADAQHYIIKHLRQLVRLIKQLTSE